MMMNLLAKLPRRSRAIPSLMVLLIGFGGCTVMEGLWDDRTRMELAEEHGYNTPVIEATYSDSAISPGTLWRIYIKGEDFDGDLQFIHVLLETPCRPDTPVRLRVDTDQQEAVSGFVVLDTFGFGGIHNELFGLWIRLNITLEDVVGHQSEPVEFYPTIYFGAESEGPPDGLFDDRFLGRIPTRFNAFEPCGIGFGVAPPR